MNAKRKGSVNERKSRDLLMAAGYSVTKAGGSLGAWDLIGIRPDGFVLIQVKSNRLPGIAEMNRLRNFECPFNCRKLVHRWNDYARDPVVVEVAHPDPDARTLPELMGDLP